MGKRVRLKRGDIFQFELDEARYGLGQVIEPGTVFYITVLRAPVPDDFDLAGLDTRDILLCGWTTDALLFHGRWHVIGTLPVQDDAIPRPCSKVECEGERWITDFCGKFLRHATPFEWERLDYRSSHAPITYQDAFRAHHGLAEMKAYHKRLGIDHVREQAAICSA